MSNVIYCKLYNLAGVAWEGFTDELVERFINDVANSELMGHPPDLVSFVGTANQDGIIGGYFAIQYEAALKFLQEDKSYDTQTVTPFENVLFVIFIREGKALIQHRRFAYQSISLTAVLRLFQTAINKILEGYNVGFVLGINPVNEIVERETFLREFASSDRVVKLVVDELDANLVPENTIYYNPQKDKNDIVRDSHKHDYEEIEEVAIEAKPHGNIKRTHIGKDLIQSGIPKFMKFVTQLGERILKRKPQTSFTVSVKEKDNELSQEILDTIVNQVRREGVLELGDNAPQNDKRQLNLFEHLEKAPDDKGTA